MGCSHVFGVGNPYEDTIGQQIHYRTGIPVINMGVPGGSNDVIFNNAMKMLQEYGKPKKLFILWTYWSRFTHIQRYYEPNDYGIGWWIVEIFNLLIIESKKDYLHQFLITNGLHITYNQYIES